MLSLLQSALPHYTFLDTETTHTALSGTQAMLTGRYLQIRLPFQAPPHWRLGCRKVLLAPSIRR
jgi:hypothetical protein